MAHTSPELFWVGGALSAERRCRSLVPGATLTPWTVTDPALPWSTTTPSHTPLPAAPPAPAGPNARTLTNRVPPRSRPAREGDVTAQVALAAAPTTSRAPKGVADPEKTPSPKV